MGVFFVQGGGGEETAPHRINYSAAAAVVS